LDREVLGVKEWPGRSRIVLDRGRDGNWRINAGQLLGLNADSVLAVYGPGASSDQPLGHVKVTEAGVASSAVIPCGYGNIAENQKLVSGSRCEPVFVTFDTRALTLALEDVAAATPESSLALATLRKELAPLEEEKGSLIRLVEDSKQAAWRLQIDGDKCFLIPRSGVLERSTAANGAQESLIEPFDRNPKTLLPKLKQRLDAIARAQALISLTEQPALEFTRSPDSVSIAVAMWRFKDRSDKVGEMVNPGTGIQLFSGDRIAFRLKNTSRHSAVYPTLLFIDSNFEITSIYPNAGEIVEALPPGESFLTSFLRVNAKTIGQEQLVAIAVKANGPPFDFSSLSRGADAVRGEAPRSPLGQLLKQAMYREGSTRGVECAEIEDSALAHIVWQTQPVERK